MSQELRLGATFIALDERATPVPSRKRQYVNCPMHRRTLHRYNQPGDARFLTFSCYRRQQFLRSERTKVWLGESVERACLRHDVALWGYVFMPEHVHLLVRPRNDDHDIGEFLRSVKESVTRKAMGYRQSSRLPECAWERHLDVDSGRVRFRFWQPGGGYDRNLFTDGEVIEKLTYMHNNPVVRELCESPTDWKWSSASFYGGLGPGPLTLERGQL